MGDGVKNTRPAFTCNLHGRSAAHFRKHFLGLILLCIPTASSFQDNNILFVFKYTHCDEGRIVVEVCADSMYCS